MHALLQAQLQNMEYTIKNFVSKQYPYHHHALINP